jgi:hypothetical protein
MTEDKFEDFLKKAAQSYNVPPARTPREDMWSAIQAERAAGPRIVYGGESAVREPSVRRFGSRIWIGAAAAAVLLLATGVGLGRWSASSNISGSVATTNPPKAELSPAPIEGISGNPVPDNAGTGAPSSVVGGAKTPSQVATRGPGSGQQPGLRTETERQVAGGRNDIPPQANSSSSAYQLTAVRHLSEAEALLTSFRTRSSADQQMDAQLGSWARELLSNTRLLLDSPVANDPQRRPLLEDLELVLVQIVQLSPGSTPQDRELIEKTLQHDHVMTRLRTAIPAGSQRGS